MANFTLTATADTVLGGAADDTVNGTAATLNAGDQLAGGVGIDTLALYGSGVFRVDQLATFDGFERIALNSIPGSSFVSALYLGSQSVVVTGGAGSHQIISASASNWNAGNTIDGGSGFGTLWLNKNGADSATYDLTTNTLTHINYLLGSGTNLTLKINSTVAAGVTTFSNADYDTNLRLITSDATLDLSHSSVSGFTVASTNATGTIFTVKDISTAFQISGGSGTDTITALGFTFSSDQRNAIFATASVERIVDASGSYTAPAPNPSLFTLTADADTVSGMAGDDTVNGTAATLNAGDQLAGGVGIDTLALYGSGVFRVDQLATFDGFERIALNSIPGSSFVSALYLGSQSVAVTGGAGSHQIISASASNWNAGNTIDGGSGFGTLWLNKNGADSATYDLTTNTLTHINYLLGSGTNLTLKINSTVAAGVTTFSNADYDTNLRLITSDATLDLSHSSVSGFTVASTNATGTIFTVKDISTAFQISGGSGTDTITALGFTFSSDQRNAIFATASVERIVDASGSYTVDIAPTITSNGGGDTAVASAAENTAAVTTVTATDPDIGQTLSYTISGGADASKFTIGTSTGALSFVSAPNFELPTDAGGNNIYDVIVQASDGHGGIDAQAISVSVTDQNEAPVFSAVNMAGQLLLGVNLAGAEFGTPDHVPGVFGTDYIYPTHTEIDYYAAKGMSVVRLPFLWERLQHSENGPFDGAELARIDDVVSYATGKGLKIEIEPHNYGYGFGALIGSAQTPNAAFADLWGKLAFHYQSNPSVIFGLMNEPHDQSASVWLGSANAAIAAIRAAGASQEILVPGSYWDGAWTWTTSENAAVIGAGVQDPAHNFAFEVHQYLDADGSGTHAGVVSADIGVERLTAITQWAVEHKQRLFLGEVGVATDQTSLTALDRMLSYMHQHTDVWQGVTYWAGGPWWDTPPYMFSIEPQNVNDPNNYGDKPQMGILMARGADTAAASILENTTAVTSGMATDPDTGQTLSYSISGGADASKFAINAGTGALSFITAPNFEAPTDAGANNIYDVTVQVSDGHGGIDTQAIAVTVTDVFENSAPNVGHARFNNALYFSAFSPASGDELYKLGADGSVTFWKDINPGTGNSSPHDFTQFNNALYFAANTAATGNELYKLGADGSVTFWADINPGAGGSNPTNFTEFNNALYFNATTAATGNELYKLGADGSVTFWADINPGAVGSNPTNFTEFNNALYFNATTAATGNELYKLGADGSVTFWKDINPGAGGSNPTNFTEFNNALYFTALSAATGDELYKLGADGSVTFWKDINPGAGNSNPSNFTVFNDALYFSATSGNGDELYKLGADGSVTFWKDINPGAGGSNPSNFTVFNDALWFTATTAANSNELHKLGADGSVTLWTDINPGAGYANPHDLTVFNNALWFGATGPSGDELYKLGADGSVTLWTDINPGAGSSAPHDLQVVNNALYFNATGPSGDELYKLEADGSVTFWADINPGAFGSNPSDWNVFG